jgi:ferredoxin
MRPRDSMIVRVDFKVCQGHGQCVLFAPQIFELNDEGLAVVLVERPEDEAMRAAAVEAARACPVRAITLLKA